MPTDSSAISSNQEARVSVIGSRPYKDRPISKLALLKKIAIKTVSVIVLGTILASALPTGQNIMEGYAQARADIPATVQDISWVDMPPNTFLDAGFNQSGGYDLGLMMQRWLDSGVPHEDFYQILELSKDTAPMIMGTQDKAMVLRQLDRAHQANAALAQRWPQAHEKLSSPQWLAEHSKVNFSADDALYVKDVSDYIHKSMDMEVVSGSSDYLDVKDHAHAKRLVEKAMEQTGLRSLRFASPLARDPWFMGNSAYKLTQINTKIQEKTGWSGGVLGIGGRVDWVIDVPEGALGGLTLAQPTYTQSEPNILITTNFEKAIHETWHAYEIVMARKALGNPLGGTILHHVDHIKGVYLNESGQQDVSVDQMKVRYHHDVVDAVIKGHDGVVVSSPQWLSQRQNIQEQSQKILGDKRQYWFRGEEIMASAFEGQIAQQVETTAFAPGKQEAAQHQQYFEVIYRAADSMNLTQRPVSTRINVSNWNISQIQDKSTVLNKDHFQQEAPTSSLRPGRLTP